jgi:hypothetical protein
MGLLSPWFLAGAAVVSLPLYLHLLRRPSANPQPFSSLMFFERRTHISIKHRRLRHLLLLSLRLAILLLLVLTFADPFINRSAASFASDKLLLLVIDNSFSMRAGTRLDDARREARSLLASRLPSDRVQIITLGSHVRVLTDPTRDSRALLAALEGIAPGDSHASFGELAHTVRSVAERARTPVEVHLFSDMQKSAMPSNFAEMVFPGNVTLVPHSVAKTTVPNWTVETVDTPGQAWESKKVPIHAVVLGYHTPATTRAVSLVVNGKVVATRSVQVPAAGRAAVEFALPDLTYGFTRCELRIDSNDAFPADNVSRFAVQRSAPEKVLFVHEPGDSRSPLYFGAALGSADKAAFKLEVHTVGQLSNVQLSNYAFVVLSDVVSLPSSFEGSLVKYVRSGGSVLIAAGTSAARHPDISGFGDRIVDSRYYSRNREGFLGVGEADPSHPSMKEADGWSGVKFYFAVCVTAANARVVARLSDQTPLLLEKRIGDGRALLLTSGFDNLTNDFPLHPAFIPFIEQTALYLSGTERRSGSRPVDSFLELRTGKQQAATVQILDPDGRRPLSLSEAASAETFQLRRTGFYEFRLADGRQDVIGVNADRRESDLDVIPDDIMALWRGKAAGPESEMRGVPVPEGSKQYSLWWYIMVLVLAAAIAESWLASQYLGKLREEP